MIGVFDSGVGGLSVLTEVRKHLPRADLLYAADTARAPFGPRSLEEVSEISHEIAEWLLRRGATCLVIACNTASAAALESLRSAHTATPIVGMEPAVKPAAALTNSGKVAVFATAATFQGELYDSVLARFATGIDVVASACPDWVELVERGEVDGPHTVEVVRRAVDPVLAAGVDQIVLGCTHFSFLRPVISRLAGIPVIDPAPAVALQVGRVAPDVDGEASLLLAVSGDPSEFSDRAIAVAAISAPVIPLWS